MLLLFVLGLFLYNSRKKTSELEAIRVMIEQHLSRSEDSSQVCISLSPYLHGTSLSSVVSVSCVQSSSVVSYPFSSPSMVRHVETFNWASAEHRNDASGLLPHSIAPTITLLGTQCGYSQRIRRVGRRNVEIGMGQ